VELCRQHKHSAPTSKRALSCPTSL